MFDSGKVGRYNIGIIQANKGGNMAETSKTIIKFGNSVGITIDSKMAFASGIQLGDTVKVKCSPKKIVIVKE